MPAKKKSARKAATRKKVPVKVPAAGKKCERIERDSQDRLLTKAKFHKSSFRYVQSGKGAIIIGCPLKVEYERGDRAGKTVTTVWRTDRPLGEQCTQKGTGKPVGLRAHAVLVERKPGKRCPEGYESR